MRRVFLSSRIPGGPLSQRLSSNPAFAAPIAPARATTPEELAARMKLRITQRKLRTRSAFRPGLMSQNGNW